jgi:DNA topoisomerase-1
MNLVIVESPGKIKKISSYLGNDFIVHASVGHIMDLDKSNISIDINNDFKPIYTINPDKKKIVKQLQELVKNKNIYIASDQDREGEFIAESLKYVLKLKTYKRIIFNEITKQALENAISNYRDIDYNLVNAQQARRILDRIVGYKLSPLISKYIGKSNLGTGRVQSVLVKLLVEKENEINVESNKHVNKYFEGSGIFILNGNKLKTNLYKIVDNKIIKFKLQDENPRVRILELLTLLKSCKWKINEIKKKTFYKYPNAPFTTSTLQQYSFTHLGFSSSKTMSIAQKLYEAGFITYMRTDSTLLSTQAHLDIKKFIIDNYGNDYYTYKQYNSNLIAQQAHEAIRPTNFDILTIEELEQDKLYKLIWKKTISSQMAPSHFELTEIIINATNEPMVMIGQITRLLFDGYLRVFKDTKQDNDYIILDTENIIIELESILIHECYTQPIIHYNEATLIKCLESYDIGRPSTYASMIEKIIKQEYAQVIDIDGYDVILKEFEYRKGQDNIVEKDKKKRIGNEKKKFKPTELGIKTTNFLQKYFPEIVDYNFTANMEKQLDRISNGELKWTIVLHNFYTGFNKQITDYIKENPIYNINSSQTNGIIIGKYNQHDIYYTKTRYGYAIKVNDIWITISKQPTLQEAIELIEKKQTNDESIIKKLDKYIIKNGKYGPFIQTFVNKKIKFYKIINIEPEKLTLQDCKRICKNNK